MYHIISVCSVHVHTHVLSLPLPCLNHVKSERVNVGPFIPLEERAGNEELTNIEWFGPINVGMR